MERDGFYTIMTRKLTALDRQQIVVDINALRSNAHLFVGQPAMVLQVLEKLSDHGTKPIWKRKLSDYLQKHKAKLFPGTSHKHAWRIYSIDHRHFTRAHIVHDVEVAS
jgi:hypothetical protein